jgi:hypothetical protein
MAARSFFARCTCHGDTCECHLPDGRRFRVELVELSAAGSGEGCDAVVVVDGRKVSTWLSSAEIAAIASSS